MVSPSTDAADLSAKVFIGPFLPFEQGKGTFAATTSTLVCGSSEAVLIDAQHIRSDVAALGDLIERTGRRLTTIYVTHGHADHWYGAGELVARFPEARVAGDSAGPAIHPTRRPRFRLSSGPRCLVIESPSPPWCPSRSTG